MDKVEWRKKNKKDVRLEKKNATRTWSEAEVNKFDDYYTLDSSEFTK